MGIREKSKHTLALGYPEARLAVKGMPSVEGLAM